MTVIVVRNASQRDGSVRCNLDLSARTARADWRRAPMTMFVFASLTVAAAIWAIMAPRSPQAPTMDEIGHLIVLGFVP
jgi:hypothetical protein